MRVRSLIVPFVAAAALLAGCTSSPSAPPAPTTNGVENLEAEAILDKAKEALLALDSFRVVGEFTLEDQTSNIDLVFQGEDRTGSMSLGGITFDLLVVDGKSYFKGGEDLWTMFAPPGTPVDAILPLVSGKWVVVPGGDFFNFSVDDILDPGDSTMTKGDVSTIDGKKAIALKDSEGAQLYIALEGEPLPIKLVSGTDDGEINFTDINKDVTIETPDASDVFDLSSFTG